ncbi:MAG: hypothetical protein HXK59_08620 [Campylobacter concisus]|nr:hypothetical protein [Campylobacter concisus]
MSSAPKLKLLTQKTKIGDFKFKIAIRQLIKPFIFKFLVFFNRAKSFGNLFCNNKMINSSFFAIDV